MLLVGPGCLVCLLWALPVAAQSADVRPMAESSDAEPSAPAPSTEARPAADDAAPSNTVLLGFKSSSKASRLQSDAHPDGIAKGWFTVCFAPCTRRVPADARFRAVDANADPSETFRLPEGKDRFIVTTMSKKPPRTAPKLLLGFGIAALVIGPIVFVGGVAQGMSGQDPHGVVLITGAALTIGGAVATTTGIIWLVSSAKDRQTLVTVANSNGPRLALPGGIGLDSRGFTF